MIFFTFEIQFTFLDNFFVHFLLSIDSSADVWSSVEETVLKILDLLPGDFLFDRVLLILIERVLFVFYKVKVALNVGLLDRISSVHNDYFFDIAHFFLYLDSVKADWVFLAADWKSESAVKLYFLAVRILILLLYPPVTVFLDLLLEVLFQFIFPFVLVGVEKDHEESII